jgi:plasmid stabilization system protein ParE
VRVRGTCHVYQAVDLGFAVDLARAEQILARDQIQQNFKKPRRAPEAQQLQRHSLRVAQSGFPVEIGAFRSEGPVEVVIWEFGAATMAYSIPIDAALADLVSLSDHLWDHPELLRDAKQRAQQLLDAIRDAVDKPRLGSRFEDYVVFELRLANGDPVSELWTTHAATTASILRAEPGELSDQEIADALNLRCAYVQDEVVLIDWFAALLVGDDMEDERLVLELTTAELLELRDLDERLDQGVEAAYAVLTRQRSWLSSFATRSEDLGLVSQLQADAAVLFEGVDNALKLLGDQYLARMYRVASERFHLPQWDAAIERKLKVLDGIYEKLANRAASRRFEVLEVVIIVLIALSTLAPFWPLVTE